MPNSGDVVDLDLGRPKGREAGYLHPAVVVTAQRILDAGPTVIQVVPLTSTLRRFHSEIIIEPDSENGLNERPLRNVSTCGPFLQSESPPRGGASGRHVLSQIRETIAVLLDLP